MTWRVNLRAQQGCADTFCTNVLKVVEELKGNTEMPWGHGWANMGETISPLGTSG